MAADAPPPPPPPASAHATLLAQLDGVRVALAEQDWLRAQCLLEQHDSCLRQLLTEAPHTTNAAELAQLLVSQRALIGEAIAARDASAEELRTARRQESAVRAYRNDASS